MKLLFSVFALRFLVLIFVNRWNKLTQLLTFCGNDTLSVTFVHWLKMLLKFYCIFKFICLHTGCYLEDMGSFLMCCYLHSLVLNLYTPELFFFTILLFVLLFASVGLKYTNNWTHIWISKSVISKKLVFHNFLIFFKLF